MRWASCALAALSLLLVNVDTAWARGGERSPPPPPPPGAPGAPQPAPMPDTTSALVPVPDVRGMTYDEAARALFAAGLSLGGTERVSIEQLETELGRTYGPGIVVQQSPHPSAGEKPSWLARGSAVWLRMSAGDAPAPIAPVPPVVPVPVPVPGDLPLATNLPPPPPSPGSVYVPPQPGPTTVPYVPPATQPLDPTPEAALLLGERRVRRRVRLACERGRGQWHLRAKSGWAWWFGSDSGDSGAVAGADLGYTFDGCVGVDVFYRFAATRNDRTTGGTTIEDAGDFHFLGLKATYESQITSTGPWFFWAGLGGGYQWSARFMNNDTGFGLLGDAGIGYLASRNIRIRFGVQIEALLTSAGRNDPIDDGTKRWLTSVAPTLGVEFDF